MPDWSTRDIAPGTRAVRRMPRGLDMLMGECFQPTLSEEEH